MNKRLQEILGRNAEFEKQAPYNFCDRWCERCVHDKQHRCKLYLDEFEQKITCIAHGREPDDPEMTVEVMEKQYEALDKLMEEFEVADIDPDMEGDIEREETQAEIRALEHLDLLQAAEQYHTKTLELLEKIFYAKIDVQFLRQELETIAWYHTLLPVKLKRALHGFHLPCLDDDAGLCDAVAQFAICKKAVALSVDALRKIGESFPSSRQATSELVGILRNVFNRIEKLEEGI